MARNLKKDYLKKLINTETPNGYKFDLANYLSNPHRHYDYPSFEKTLKEENGKATKRRVYYLKYYDGTGEYIAETYELPTEEGWHVCENVRKETLMESNRYSVNTLISFC